MTYKDLMVGDYVTFKECQEDITPTIIKIWKINGDNEAFVSIDNDYALDDIAIDDEIVGVPLTSEILEKNGFVKWKHGYMWKERIGIGGQTVSASSPIEIIIYEGGHSFVLNPHDGREFQGSIQFVHELQHCLRLLKIEKKIEL